MASINLSGVLRDPLGEVSYGNKMRFTHNTTTGETVKGFRSSRTIEINGEYDFDVEYGNVHIESWDYTSGLWISHGVITINSDTPATSIPALLGITTPATDADLLVFQALVADAELYRDESLSAKDLAISARDESVSASNLAIKSFSTKDLMISSTIINEGDFVRAGILNEYRDYKVYSTQQKDSDVDLDNGLYASPIKNRIAVIGDSISQSSYGRSDDWVSEIKKKIELTNTPAEIKNFSTGGATIESAVTGANSVGESTMVQACLDWDADDVIIALGFNDCIVSTIDEAEAELRVDNLVTALRVDTTGGKFVRLSFARQVIWDATVGTPTTDVSGWTNKSVIPLQHTVENDTIIQNDHLDLLVSQARINKYATLNHMHEYMYIVAEGSKISVGSNPMSMWKTARLGWHTDGLHPSRNAHRVYASQIADNLLDAMFQDDYINLKSNKSSTDIFDFDAWWTDHMIATDADFDRYYRLDDGGSFGQWGTYFSDDMVSNVATWYFPQRNMSVYIQRTAFNKDSPVSVSFSGVPSRTQTIGLLVDGVDNFENSYITYNSISGGDTGSFVFTFIPSSIMPSLVTGAGTYKMGLRIQNTTMGKATYYEFYSDLVVSN